MDTLIQVRRSRYSTMPEAPTVRWRAVAWTTQPPAVPGLYHHRSTGEPGMMRLAHVRRNSAGELVARFAHGEEPVAGKSGEWAGPLTMTFGE